ncbi:MULTISPECIES: ribosome hibernation-promoting factor, HPF/YfiA family [Micrococcaceae]|uniref:ribosome hibernation-promoting factor, HPF/YfiA family n=1 Tax=unclassified Kocuria TaxID=2649579 RepID=UPI001010A6D7|nr:MULTISPECIES: ribosome-associated translation inhibitor RaiA [unclassified Kocuria]
MELNVYGRNVKVPDRFREYAEEKVEKFEKLNDHMDVVDVKVSKVGNGPQAITVEITVHGKGPVLRAEAQGSDKFAVFEDAYAKLLERLRRARDRRKIHRGNHRPQSVSEATGSIPVIDGSSGGQVPIEDIVLEKQPGDDQQDSFDDGYSLADDVSPVEIRRKTFPTEKITVDQAVDRMELVGHDFYLFVDSELDRPAAVYRRKGWTYGVIVLGDDAPPEGLNETRMYKPVTEG